MYGFLLVDHCNYGAILYRLGDTATSKIAKFYTPSVFSAPAGGDQSEFREGVSYPSTRMTGLPYGEKRTMTIS